MNRSGGQPRQSGAVPPGYRSAQPPSAGGGANGMFYGGGLGAGGAQQNRAGILGQQSSLQSGFPPTSGLGRAGPPGFGGRGADPNDFPALGSLNASHNQHGSANSTYASQAQPSQGGSNHLQQQMYNLHIGQGQGQMDSGLAPPPPPGLSGPATSPSQPNGSGEGIRDDFPALGVGEKERMASMLKMGGAPGSNQAGSPQQSLNGPSTSSQSATPSNNPLMGTTSQGPPSATDSWARQSPSRPTEPLVRPVQQIMSSPVDKWGLKALLYEIRTQMGKGDRSMLMFGEDLEQLGMDVSTSDPLYSSFVTPWVEPGSIQHPPQIEDMFVIPTCYHVVPPPVDTKLPNFSEETLFYIFYAAPQDIVQLMAAEELYNRGWRFNTDLRVWLTSGQLAQIDTHADLSSHPSALRGPFTVFNPSTWSRQDTAADFTIETAHLEATRRAADIAAEQSKTRKDTARSPINGNNNLASNPQYQNLAAAH